MKLPEGNPNFKMPSHILDPILAESRVRAEALRPHRRDLERRIALLPHQHLFADALRGDTVRVIAEVKRRSPSLGAIDEALEPAALAAQYTAGGAAAVSVLTELHRFGGSIGDLRAVVASITQPVLRKDFVVDELQLLEARAEGAAAALLIVRALSVPELAHLVAFADALGLGTLVEAHTPTEVAAAIDAGATVIGVNARDLDTLEIDREAAWQMLANVPASLVAVAESGMATAADVEVAARAGADAVLIGSALVASGDPASAVRSMTRIARRGR